MNKSKETVTFAEKGLYFSQIYTLAEVLEVSM